MTILAIREFLMDFRNMFRGWRLVVHLALLGLVILMSRTGGEAEIGYMVMLYCVLSTSLIRIKINKLFYLLPTRKQDRINHVLTKCFGLFIYNVLIYLVVVIIVTLLSDYQFSQELPTMICIVIPVFIAYCSLSMGNGYNMGKSKDEETTKKYKKQYIVSCFMAFSAMFISFMININYFRERLMGIPILIITLISYCFAFACMFSQISALKNTELSEENVRKVEKLFE